MYFDDQFQETHGQQFQDEFYNDLNSSENKAAEVKEDLFTYTVYLDGEEIKSFKDQKNDFQAFGFLLRFQGNSVDYALKYGGYSVTVTDQKTGITSNYS